MTGVQVRATQYANDWSADLANGVGVVVRGLRHTDRALMAGWIEIKR